MPPWLPPAASSCLQLPLTTPSACFLAAQRPTTAHEIVATTVRMPGKFYRTKVVNLLPRCVLLHD